MKTLETTTTTPAQTTPTTQLDAAALATLGCRSELLAKLMRTGVRAGSPPRLKFA